MLGIIDALGGQAGIDRIGADFYTRLRGDPLLRPVFRDYSDKMLDHIRTMMFATLANEDERVNDAYLRLSHRDLVQSKAIGDAEFDRTGAILDVVLADHGISPEWRAAIMARVERYRDVVLNR